MTTTFSTAALVIIALSVVLALVILLTLASLCVYVATGKPLVRLFFRPRGEDAELFALQEMWRQSYWWVNANWKTLSEMAASGSLQPTAALKTDLSIDFLTWIHSDKTDNLTVFVTLNETTKHFAVSFATESNASRYEITGVEKAGFTLPLLVRAVTKSGVDDLKNCIVQLEKKRLPINIDSASLAKEAAGRRIIRLAKLFKH